MDIHACNISVNGIGLCTDMCVSKKKCCLLVLNSITSPPRWIRQPQLSGVQCMVCVCVLFFFADVPAPVFSGTSAFSLRLMPSRLTPGTTSVLTVSFTLPPLPLLALRARPFHLPPPPRLLLYTPYVISTDKLNK